MTPRRTKIARGVYRIGNYVAFREDTPSVGEVRDRWGNLLADEGAIRNVTWGLIDADTYDRRQGDVGLPDCPHEFPTLAAATSWVTARNDD